MDGRQGFVQENIQLCDWLELEKFQALSLDGWVGGLIWKSKNIEDTLSGRD